MSLLCTWSCLNAKEYQNIISVSLNLISTLKKIFQIQHFDLFELGLFYVPCLRLRLCPSLFAHDCWKISFFPNIKGVFNTNCNNNNNNNNKDRDKMTSFFLKSFPVRTKEENQKIVLLQPTTQNNERMGFPFHIFSHLKSMFTFQYCYIKQARHFFSKA